MAAPIPVLTAADVQQRLAAKRPPTLNYYAFYSSFLGGIVTDPALMTLPIDDHMVHRGHAVFDTASLTHGKVYRLGIHLDRLFSSAEKARIPVPMSREELTQVVLQTCAASKRRDAAIRFWLSTGPGDLAITPPNPPSPCFYLLVFGGLPSDPAWKEKGIPEVTVERVPMKPQLLATMKSNNYLLNALTAMDAKERGGTYGILVANGFVAESCTLNVGIVDKAGVFRTPNFDEILAGTTVRRAMELYPGLPGATGVQQGPVRVEELFEATEVILLAGDKSIYPVVSLDGRPIGDGRPGPMSRAILQAILDEMAAGTTGDFIDVPYE